MPAPQHFVLCADDYAMTPGVSRGILSLLEAGRITATGAMTNRPHWPQAAPELAPFVGKADLGLHFNLTCGSPLTRMARLAPNRALPRLGVILRGGVLGQLLQAEIAQELKAQLDAFEQAMGRAPDFVDGHQHVHALPGVRRAVAEVLAARYPDKRPYVREAADSPLAILRRGVSPAKAMLLTGLTAPFGPGMRARGYATNAGFSGYSDFDPAGDFGTAFARYLVAPGARHLVMCHPGEVDDELLALDPATASRPLERDFLLSGRFTDLCAAAGLRPARFSEIAA